MLYALEEIIVNLVNIYSFLILVYVVMSWIPRGRWRIVEQIRYILAVICEPYLGIFRRIIPTFGMFDFSPVIAIIVLELVVRLVVWIL